MILIAAIAYQRNRVLFDSNDTQQFSRTGRKILHRLTFKDARGLSQVENAIKAIP